MYYSQTLNALDNTGQNVSYIGLDSRALLITAQMLSQGHDTSMVDLLDEATLRQYGEGIQVAMDPNDEDEDEGMNSHDCFVSPSDY